MPNQIFKENVQGWKHPGSCAFAEPESVVQKVLYGHKNPNDNHNYHDENHVEIEFFQGNSNRSA